MSSEQAVTIYRGEPVQLNFALDTPADISGWTLAFTLARAKNGATKLLTQTPEIVDVEVGSFKVLIGSEDTDLEPESYWWDVWRTDEGNERLIAIGSLTIQPDVRLPG